MADNQLANTSVGDIRSNANSFESNDRDDEQGNVAVAEPVVRPKRKLATENEKKPQRQPRYHVILWNDEDHSYDYVIQMMLALFGHPEATGKQIAEQVDRNGKAVCLTTTMEHAELKRDQIHAYGKEASISRCKGSMSASIEADVH